MGKRGIPHLWGIPLVYKGFKKLNENDVISTSEVYEEQTNISSLSDSQETTSEKESIQESSENTEDIQALIKEIKTHNTVIETATLHLDNVATNIQTFSLCSCVLVGVLIGAVLASIISKFFKW